MTGATQSSMRWCLLVSKRCPGLLVALWQKGPHHRKWLHLRKLKFGETERQCSNTVWEPHKPTSTHRTQASGCICKPLVLQTPFIFSFLYSFTTDRLSEMRAEVVTWKSWFSNSSCCPTFWTSGCLLCVQFFNGSSNPLRSKVSIHQPQLQKHNQNGRPGAKESSFWQEHDVQAYNNDQSFQMLWHDMTYHDFG